jgi:hypothetical protein
MQQTNANIFRIGTRLAYHIVDICNSTDNQAASFVIRACHGNTKRGDKREDHFRWSMVCVRGAATTGEDRGSVFGEVVHDDMMTLGAEKSRHRNPTPT